MSNYLKYTIMPSVFPRSQVVNESISQVVVNDERIQRIHAIHYPRRCLPYVDQVD